jgi:uncharacterized protein Yka (UPF0111/DUF47 family)
MHKYSAIEKLKTLLEVEHPYKFIVYTILGEIYNEVEQINDSLTSYQNALVETTKMPA